jgi:4-hydroxy-tetrahydrodipicolinate synthase
MADFHKLAGVYAAALTPLRPDFASNFTPDLDSIPLLLDWLAQRGCHGALLLGTTGEGPSFAPQERLAILRAACAVRQRRPDFRLLAGTGTPSLEETIELTRAAFDLGMDGVVVLPPYYFRKVSDEGLFAWFSEVLRRAVPAGGMLLGYHIPPISGVPISPELIERLIGAFPSQFAGLKDSSGDADYARLLGERFGQDLLLLNGTDRLLSLALQAGASGCITALANLCAPDLRRVWDSHRQGQPDGEAQARLNLARSVTERYPPAPPLLKALLSRKHGFPRWAVRPPLLPAADEIIEKAENEIEHAFLDADQRG